MIQVLYIFWVIGFDCIHSVNNEIFMKEMLGRFKTVDGKEPLFDKNKDIIEYVPTSNSCTEGAFGSVTLFRINDQLYALKRFKNPRDYVRELRVHKEVNDRLQDYSIEEVKVPRIRGIYIGSSTLGILMDGIMGQTSGDFLRTNPDDVFLQTVIEMKNHVLWIVNILHDRGIYNIDLNLCNIMVDNENNIWLVDVGLWKFIEPFFWRYDSIAYVGTFSYWGSGFIYLNYYKNDKTVEFNIFHATKLAANGDKNALAKITLHWIYILASNMHGYTDTVIPPHLEQLARLLYDNKYMKEGYNLLNHGKRLNDIWNAKEGRISRLLLYTAEEMDLKINELLRGYQEKYQDDVLQQICDIYGMNNYQSIQLPKQKLKETNGDQTPKEEGFEEGITKRVVIPPKKKSLFRRCFGCFKPVNKDTDSNTPYP